MDFRVAGTVYQTFRTIECLQRLGMQVHLVVISGYGPLADQIPADVGVTVLLKRWPMARLSGMRSAFCLVLSVVGLGRFLRRAKPDVLLSCASKVNLVSLAASALWRSSAALVLTITAEIYHRYPGARDRRLTPWLIGKLYARADRILTVSSGLTEDLEDLSDALKGKTVTVYPPLDIDKIRRQMTEDVDHPWFRDREIPIISAVGRVSEEKDLRTLVRAMALVNKTRPARLAIIGPGAPCDVEALGDLADELNLADLVAFLGLQRNPYKYMARSDCFVLTSLWEGFGIVIAEALLCGCPVVSTDCRWGPREILDDGKYGALVPVRDHEAVAKAILEKLSAVGGQEERRERGECFGYEPMTKRYEGVFSELLHGEKTRR